jgi:hypothetical protein
MSVIGILQQLTFETVLGAIISSVMCLSRSLAVRIYALCLSPVLFISLVSASGQSQKQIEEYRKDFEQELLPRLVTAMNATQVGDVVGLQDGSSYLPRTSEGLTMEAKQKVDAWGSPFCIIPVGDRVAVVSGGPSHLSCDVLPLTAEQIGKSKGLHFGPSGVVAFITIRARRWVE